jgi:dolichol-phosphate mannosyltransferase
LAEGAELVLEMDCDFSHDPADVPRLIAASEEADLVLGSRYVDGGAIANWGPGRRFVSAGGSLYARLLLNTGVRDLTGGFKCYRRRVLETIDLDAVSSRGYAFQIETTYRTLRAGFRVVEVPITFVDRAVGGSKMSRGIVVEAIWKVPALRGAALLGRL